MRIAPALALLLALTGCPSGESIRGVEHPGTELSSASDSHADAWAPEGFRVTRFATDLLRPRHMVFAPNGELLVATRKGVVVLWDANHDGQSDEHERALLGAPDISHQGIALSPDG